MFRKAYDIAQHFTMPIILSRKPVKGPCESSLGAVVIVNEDGWFVTAGHILKHLDQLSLDEMQTRRIEKERDQLLNGSLNREERRRLERTLPKLSDKSTDRYSHAVCGPNGPLSIKAGTATYLDMPGDIGFAQIENFDPKLVSVYPEFQDPSKPRLSGTSLCKLGFPFHDVNPTWNAGKNKFDLPPETFPIPRFPIDGIFTREIFFESDPANPFPVPVTLVETSTPGLKGQSGGPIFDQDGTVWAIQSRTMHLPLGFNPPVPGAKNGETEHQFLNVGWGVSTSTICPMFQQFGVKIRLKQ